MNTVEAARIRPVSQGYGLTESGGVAFIQTESHHRIGGCGVPLPQTEWKCDADGEILLRNPGVFKGYFLDEKASTASLESDGWLRTGDIIDILDNGEIAVVDRKKAIIITAGGKNISPANLEAELKMIDIVGQAAAIGDQRKFVSALLVLDPEVAPIWAQRNGIEFESLDELGADHEHRDVGGE